MKAENVDKTLKIVMDLFGLMNEMDDSEYLELRELFAKNNININDINQLKIALINKKNEGLDVF